jgi:hypothetical protein
VRASALVAVALLTGSCGAEYGLHTEPDRHGNPGKDMEMTYSGEFLVSEDHFFSILDAFYSFTREQKYDEFKFGDCFRGFLGVLYDPDELPCIAVHTSKGVPVKRHATLTITRKAFYRADGGNHLAYKISLYDLRGGREATPTLSEIFALKVGPRLKGFSNEVTQSISAPVTR